METVARLRVGVDVSPLALTRAGTARYLRGLLAELEREPALELRRYGSDGAGPLAKVARDTTWYPAVLPLVAGRDRVDILHCPGPRGPLACPVPLAVTIHDLAVVRHPRAFNAWTRLYTARTLPRLVRAAGLVLTVSAFSKREIVELLEVEPARVRVVPNGVGPPFVGPDGPAAPGAYVLAVSTLEPRKNLTRVVEAFRQARLGAAELVVVGAAGWGDVRVRSEAGVRWAGEVDDRRLAALYRGALCVVYASLYEGFGLPVLEAMACGAAVAAPNGPPYDEFAAGVAVAVDPLDAASIGAGIEEAIDRRTELGPAGRARARAFTWARTASETVAAYRSLARSRA